MRGTTQLVHVTTDRISFSYPTGWPRTQWNGPTPGGIYLVAAVSNHQLKTPCFQLADGSGGCGQPVDRLQPATLLVEWWEITNPGSTFAGQSGTPLVVGGLPAKSDDPAAVILVCPNLAADSAVQVSIQAPEATGNYFRFLACMSGPGVVAEKSEAMDILVSAQFT